MRDVQLIAIGGLEVVLPDVIQAVHGIARVRDNDAGEKVEFTAQREVEATAYIGANYAFDVLPGLLDGLAHLALDAVRHQV
jgi:hypothetical protein